MNYTDFKEIKEDEFSGQFFLHLKVVGWVSKNRSGKNYLVECGVCAKDPELHGDGLYTIDKPNLIKGVIPCACAKTFRWSDDQWIVKLQRYSDIASTRFVRYIGGIGSKRSAVFLCKEHGEYQAQVYDFIEGKGCRRCSKNSLKPDEVMISGFMNSRSFDLGTTFKRSDKRDSKGAKVYWQVTCSVCDVTYESNACHLRKGKQGCECGYRNQKFSYLLQILDNKTPIAIKFGVTKSLKRRVAEHENGSPFDIEPLAYWEFPDNISCKAAELECSRELFCGVLSQKDFPDGFTETTYISNIDSVKDIFSRHGGNIINV